MVKKIKLLHQIGVKTVAEAQRHLKDYVQNELFRGKQPLSSFRRRFNPTTEDIRNILNTQRTGARKATDDQENLNIYCEKWQDDHINDSIFYRVCQLRKN